jgi:NADH dehydrogenase/NADH:ubiquinone oxidoreductase subunit G
MPNVTINGKNIVVDEGRTVLKLHGRQVSIFLPSASSKGKPPLGACRVCIVEVEGQRASWQPLLDLRSMRE